MRHRLQSATRARDAQSPGSRRCRTEARYRTIHIIGLSDQPHEFLGCNDFLARLVVVRYKGRNDVTTFSSCTQNQQRSFFFYPLASLPCDKVNTLLQSYYFQSSKKASFVSEFYNLFHNLSTVCFISFQ